MTAPPVTIGIPGEPVAQGRPRVAVVAGRARAYDPKTSRDWKATAQQHARDQMQRAGATVFVGPVRVAVSCVFTRPKTTYRKRSPRGREPKTTKPDADNLAKSVLDALTGVVWLDDKQVYELHIAKWVGAQDEAPMTGIEVRAYETARE